MPENKFKTIILEAYEFGNFVLKILADLCWRRCRPKSKVRRVAIIAREDLFPANHGGAVKIVQTARSLSCRYDEVIVITQSRNSFLIFRKGVVFHQDYPRFVRWAFWIPRSLQSKKIEATGLPPREHWLAYPKFDNNFKFRVLYLAVVQPFEVMQAEFSHFIFACSWVSRIYSDIAKISVEHNVEFLRIGATYKLSPSDIVKMKMFEIAACMASDRVVAVSEVDRGLLLENGVESSRIAVIPLGVDLAYFRSTDLAAVEAIRRKYNILKNDFVIFFHGVLSYKPNADAVQLLAQEIMPRLRLIGCPVKCLVVGKNPPCDLAADDFILTGPVDQLPNFIQTADVAVVPLMEGGGTRLKILEYFAASVPVISTSKGAEGIKVTHRRDILIEDTTAGIARSVDYLHKNADKRQSLGASGRQFVQRFDWNRLAGEYCRLYGEIISQKKIQHVVKQDSALGKGSVET